MIVRQRLNLECAVPVETGGRLTEIAATSTVAFAESSQRMFAFTGSRASVSSQKLDAFVECELFELHGRELDLERADFAFADGGRQRRKWGELLSRRTSVANPPRNV